MASQIIRRTTVYSTIYSGADQIKHQSSATLAFVRGIHRSPVKSPQKGPTTLKMFLFDSHHEKLFESFMQSPSLMRHKFYVPNQQPNATRSFISSLQAEKLILKNDNPLIKLIVKLYVDMHYWNTNNWIVRNTLKWVLNCNTTTFYIRKNYKLKMSPAETSKQYRTLVQGIYWYTHHKLQQLWNLCHFVPNTILYHILKVSGNLESGTWFSRAVYNTARKHIKINEFPHFGPHNINCTLTSIQRHVI